MTKVRKSCKEWRKFNNVSLNHPYNYQLASVIISITAATSATSSKTNPRTLTYS